MGLPAAFKSIILSHIISYKTKWFLIFSNFLVNIYKINKYSQQLSLSDYFSNDLGNTKHACSQTSDLHCFSALPSTTAHEDLYGPWSCTSIWHHHAFSCIRPIIWDNLPLNNWTVSCDSALHSFFLYLKSHPFRLDSYVTSATETYKCNHTVLWYIHTYNQFIQLSLHSPHFTIF